MATLARAANAAWDRSDMPTFDLLAELSGREQDEAARRMTTEELEAVLASQAHPNPKP